MNKKRKGLSAEDKRKVILGIYHDKKEPFNLKEIETLASRLGVVQQSVKDMNQSLIDDNLVLTDKIGSANFYWSFPAKYYQDEITRKADLESQIERTKSSILKMKQEIQTIAQNQTNPNRAKDLVRWQSLKEQESTINNELDKYKYNDPEEVKRITDQMNINMGSVNRWTDNIWIIKSFLTKKKGMAGKDVDKMFGIDSSFDYVTMDDFISEQKTKKRK